MTRFIPVLFSILSLLFITPSTVQAGDCVRTKSYGECPTCHHTRLTKLAGCGKPEKIICLHCKNVRLNQAKAERRRILGKEKKIDQKKASHLKDVKKKCKDFFNTRNESIIYKIDKDLATYPKASIRILEKFWKRETTDPNKVIWVVLILNIDKHHAKARAFLKKRGMKPSQISKLI